MFIMRESHEENVPGCAPVEELEQRFSTLSAPRNPLKGIQVSGPSAGNGKVLQVAN